MGDLKCVLLCPVGPSSSDVGNVIDRIMSRASLFCLSRLTAAFMCCSVHVDPAHWFSLKRPDSAFSAAASSLVSSVTIHNNVSSQL